MTLGNLEPRNRTFACNCFFFGGQLAAISLYSPALPLFKRFQGHGIFSGSEFSFFPRRTGRSFPPKKTLRYPLVVEDGPFLEDLPLNKRGFSIAFWYVYQRQHRTSPGRWPSHFREEPKGMERNGVHPSCRKSMKKSSRKWVTLW